MHYEHSNNFIVSTYNIKNMKTACMPDVLDAVPHQIVASLHLQCLMKHNRFTCCKGFCKAAKKNIT